MATRSNIAVQHCNGTVSDIYCHSDGYLSHVGYILHKFWSSTSLLRSLIGLGDISVLGETLDTTTAYYRDSRRGEDFEPARVHSTLQEYLDGATHEYRMNWGYEYLYVFTRRRGWLVKIYDEPWKPLHLALIEEVLINDK